MAGQIAGLVKEIKPAKDIIEDIMNEANEVISLINGLVKEE